MKMIASQRVEAVVRVVVDAARKAAEEAIKDLENRKVLNDSNFQRVLAQGDKVSGAVKTTLMTTLAELAENVVGRLRLVSGGNKIAIAATDGKETIAKAHNVFPGCVDPDFKNWGCDVETKPTESVDVAVYDMIKDSTFAEIFGGFGENIDRLCFTQSQIKAFVRDHSEWLRIDGYGTFFLFKVNGEFFIASVDVGTDGLCVVVFRFSRDGVWVAENGLRVVVPQLTLEP